MPNALALRGHAMDLGEPPGATTKSGILWFRNTHCDHVARGRSPEFTHLSVEFTETFTRHGRSRSMDGHRCGGWAVWGARGRFHFTALQLVTDRVAPSALLRLAANHVQPDCVEQFRRTIVLGEMRRVESDGCDGLLPWPVWVKRGTNDTLAES